METERICKVNRLIAILVIVLSVVCCGLMVAVFVTEAQADAVNAQPLVVDNAQPLVVDNDQLKAAGWIALAAVVVFVFVKIARSPHAVVVFFILASLAVMCAALYAFNSSGGEVVGMVQPVGNDPAYDLLYSEINANNSTTNIKTAGAFSIYVVVTWIVVVTFAVLGVFLHYYKKQ